MDDYFFDNQKIEPGVSGEGDSLPPSKGALPTGFVQAGELVSESEWGKINVNEIQGITHSETHWYISTQWELFKISRESFPRVDAHVHLLAFRKFLKGGWYRHFGGIVHDNGLIYIATTGRTHALTTERATPIVVVLNANLEFVKYGFFPREVQNNAAWVGFNPVTQHLYSSRGVQELLEYDPEFANGDTIKLIQRHRMHYVDADVSSREWDNVVSQGGAFSTSGLFYYVVDKKDSRDHAFTGIHGFELRDGDYHEFEISGVNNKGEDTKFIGIKYVGDNENHDRLWEMEDITVVRENENEFIYHLQLHNGKPDFARVVRYRLM